jgi:hypothetical protein
MAIDTRLDKQLSYHLIHFDLSAKLAVIESGAVRKDSGSKEELLGPHRERGMTSLNLAQPLRLFGTDEDTPRVDESTTRRKYVTWPSVFAFFLEGPFWR